MRKNSYSCFEEKENTLNPFSHLARWIRNIKHAYQRIKYGYCERDVWSIDTWFLNVFPNMIEELKETAHGFPVNPIDDCSSVSENVDDGMERWQNTLAEMAFYFREANEDTCKRKNRYQEEYDKALTDFDAKYGIWGEGLKSEDEKKEEKESGLFHVYTLRDVPEYKEIWDNYFAEDLSICQYREECKDKGMEMFRDNFRNLWD